MGISAQKRMAEQFSWQGPRARLRCAVQNVAVRSPTKKYDLNILNSDFTLQNLAKGETMTLELNQCLEPLAEEVAAKVIDGEAILINLATGVYYSMDKVGALIWEMITGKHSLEEIVAAVVARYEVSQEQASGDIRRLGEELLQENLVKAVPNGAASSATEPGQRRREKSV